MDYLLEKLKDYKILYCEDDETVATIFTSLLHKFTNNFFYAKNGEEGLELYYKEKPDIVITDIEMPKKTGIELIEDIRKENEDIPIVITTAYGDGDFLFKAIDLNVNKFLIKPIDKDKLLKVLTNIIASLEDKKNSEKFRMIKEKKKLEENTKEVVNQFLDISVSPIMIVKNGKITNINNLFTELFTDKNLKLLLEDINYFDNLIEKREEYKSSINDLNEENYYENEISIIKPNGQRKVFQVIIKKVYFKEETEKSIIYTFQNITYLEYQKLKIKNYSERLKDFIINSKYKTHTKEINKEEFDKQIEKELENKKERTFNEEEAKLLRKNHDEKISAQEFLASLDDYVIEDIQELEECEEEIDISLDKFEKTPTKEILEEIIVNIEKYAKAIKNLQEFDELYEAVNSTINLLINIEEDLNEENIPKIQKFVKNILLDLKSWRITIFEEAQTKDIHYLDSSLLSSCLQFELDLKGEKPEEDECDFEFF